MKTSLVVDDRRKSEHGDSLCNAMMVDDSFKPRYERNEVILVNKSLRPVVGDDVVIRDVAEGKLAFNAHHLHNLRSVRQYIARSIVGWLGNEHA